MRQKQRYYRT